MKIDLKQLRRLLALLVSAGMLLTLGTGCTAKARARRHLQRGDKYFDAGQYSKAEVEYLNVLQRRSLNARALSRLGTIYFEQGRADRAYAFLAKASQLATNDMDLRVKLGTILLSAGKVKEASGEATLVLDRMPRHPEAPILLADTTASRTNIDAVYQRLEKLITEVGDSAPIETALGTLHIRQGDTNAADAAFRRALGLEPKSSAAHFGLANLCWAANDLKGADSEFKAAAELSPARSARRIRYADFKLRVGEREEGKRLLREISKSVPDYLPAWIRRAEVALVETNYTECASLLQQVLAREPANYDALLLRGRAFLAQQDAGKALAEFERMSRVYERLPQVHYHLALAYLLNRDEPRALKSLRQATTLAPEFAEAVLLQARLNIARDDPVSAITQLTELLKRQTRLPQAQLQLAAAYTVKGDLESALATYRRLGEDYPTNAEIPMRIGLVYLQQNRREDARRAFVRTLELSTNHFPAIEKLADLDLLAGLFTNALKRAKSALEQHPTNAEPHLLLAKVHMAQAGAMVKEKMMKSSETVGTTAEAKSVLGTLPAAQALMGLAESALQRAIQLDPDFHESYLLLARLYTDTGKDQRALDELRADLARKTNDLPALILMAAIQENTKDFPAARATYERVLAISPESAFALNNLAYLYAEQFGLLDKAYETALKARNLVASKAETAGADTGGPVSRKMRGVAAYQAYTAGTLGWILFKQGDYQRALSLLQESAEKMRVERLPAEAEELFHLGMTYYMLGQEERAQNALNRALSRGQDFPGKDEAARRLAMLAIDVKTAGQEELVTLEKQLKDQPGDPVLLARIGAVYERGGKLEKALQAYEAALKQNPRNVVVLLKLALLQAGPLHHPQRAMELAKNANKLAPDDPEVAFALGRMAFEAGDYQWALGLLQQSAGQKPEDPELRYDLARAYYNVGRLAEAEAALRTVLQADPRFSRVEEARRYLEFLELSTSPVRAIAGEQKAREILKGNPGYVPALMVSALCAEKRGAPAEARETYEQVLKQVPNFPPAVKKLAGLFDELGQQEKAYEMANRAYTALPNDAEVAKTLGIVLYGRKDYRNSTRLLEESLKKGNEDAKAMYYLGMAHYQLSKDQKDRLKEQTESKKSLQRALDLQLQANLADDARRVLTALK